MTRLTNPISLTSIPAAMALFLTVVPVTSAAARAQSLREASKEAVAAKTAAGDGAEREQPAANSANNQEEEDETPGRSGLRWTGMGLTWAGSLLLAGSFTFNDSKGCGFFNELKCSQVGRVYGITGGTLVATGVAFMILDSRRTSVAISPRAVQVRMQF